MLQPERHHRDAAISVIVPVYRGGTNFQKCISSLVRTQPPPGEIIVVSDGDGEETGALAMKHGAMLIPLPGPQGPARARNAGARKASGEILFFVDADVTVPPNIMGRVAMAFEDDSDLVAIFGSYDDSPQASNFLSQYKNLFHHYIHQKARKDASTFWGACGAIRKGPFLSMGGFKESYRKPAVEDVELGYRLKKADHKIRLCRTLQVKHLKRWSVISLLQSDFLCRAIPWTELILKERMFIDDLNLRYASRISVLLAFGLLGSFIAVLWWSGAVAIFGVLALFLFIMNAPLYVWFQRKRGLGFAVRAISWHWFYYLYSGLAFGVGLVLYMRQRRGEPAMVAPEGS
jgi:glycosyltransferase involved in cell wall biosynthesis